MFKIKHTNKKKLHNEINKPKTKSKTKPKTKSKTKSKTKTPQNKLLKGGVFLGEGSYGCVVKPALPCEGVVTSPINKTLNKSVSKILIDPSESDKDEIIISNKLNTLDPKQFHFINFESACRLKNIPNERSNTVSVEYDNNTLDSYDILDNKKYDKKHCPIDLGLKPINLIMPFGGYDLLHIGHNKSNKKNILHFNLTKKMLVKNLKLCLKNLFLGLFKMHNNRIVNRDIKTENMMVNYDETTNRLDLRFIDFGLSTIIPPYYKKREYISYHGTEGCISPELIISYYIMNGDTYEDTMLNINKYIKHVLVSFNKNELIDKYKILYTFNSDIKELYLKIKKEIENNTIYDTYFGIDTNTNHIKFNAYLQKGDVYALGISLCEFLKTYNKHNKPGIKYDKELHELLINMIQPIPDKRFNIIQCINHKYFK